jgi:hypothetical protein
MAATVVAVGLGTIAVAAVAMPLAGYCECTVHNGRHIDQQKDIGPNTCDFYVEPGVGIPGRALYSIGVGARLWIETGTGTVFGQALECLELVGGKTRPTSGVGARSGDA